MILLDKLKYSDLDNNYILFNPCKLIKPINGLQAQDMCAEIAQGQKEIPVNYRCSYFVLGFLCRLLLIIQPFLEGVTIEMGCFDEDEFMEGFKLLENPEKLIKVVNQWAFLDMLEVQVVDQRIIK